MILTSIVDNVVKVMDVAKNIEWGRGNYFGDNQPDYDSWNATTARVSEQHTFLLIIVNLPTRKWFSKSALLIESLRYCSSGYWLLHLQGVAAREGAMA